MNEVFAGQCCLCNFVAESRQLLNDHIEDVHSEIFDDGDGQNPYSMHSDQIQDDLRLEGIQDHPHADENPRFMHDEELPVSKVSGKLKRSTPTEPENVKKIRNRKKPITIRGCMILVKGFACKWCNFYATDSDLLDDHCRIQHRSMVVDKPESRVELEKQAIEETFLSSRDLDDSIDPDCADYLEVQQEVLDSEEEEDETQDKSRDNESSSKNSGQRFKEKHCDKDKQSGSELDSDSNPSEGFNCWFCKACFFDVSSLNQHVEEDHYSLGKKGSETSKKSLPKKEIVNSQFYCFECCEQFKTKRTFQDHLARKHEEKKFKCSKCELSFARPDLLHNHFRTNHLLRNVVCQFCKKVISSVKTFAIHLFLVHDYKMKRGEQLTFAPDPTEGSSNKIEDTSNSIGGTSSQQNATSNLAETNQDSTQLGADKSSDIKTSSTTDQVKVRDNTDQRQFPCPSCSKSFKNKKQLRNHNVRVHAEKNILCTYCGSRFARPSLLQHHIKLMHTENAKNVPCPQCKKVLSNEKTLYLHVRFMHKDTRFLCDMCDQKFAKKEELKEHCITEHREAVLAKCQDCDEEFGTQTLLKQHRVKVHKDRPFLCEHCNQTFITNDHMTRHIQKVHQGINLPVDKSNVTPIPCIQCGKEFPSNWHLKRHVVSLHTPSDTPICKLCFKKFASNEELQVHLNTDHSDKKFECEECKKTFASTWHLKRHTDIHYSNGLNHPCSICQQSFKTTVHLKSHIKSKHEGMRNICELCDKEFSSNWYLKRHKELQHLAVKTKKREKPPPDKRCEICLKTFQSKIYLAKHVKKVHVGVSINCDHCGQEFNKKVLLNKHLKEHHADAKNFSCHLFFKLKATKPGEKTMPLVKCNQTFTSERALENHIRKYHSSKTIELEEGSSCKSKPNPKLFCNSCKIFFASEDLLKSHIATVHDESLGIKCEICFQRFSTGFEIAQHIDTVHSVKYPCSICPRTFDCNDDLDDHMYTDHMDYRTDEEEEVEEREFKTEDAIFGC